MREMHQSDYVSVAITIGRLFFYSRHTCGYSMSKKFNIGITLSSPLVSSLVGPRPKQPRAHKLSHILQDLMVIILSLQLTFAISNRTAKRIKHSIAN